MNLLQPNLPLEDISPLCGLLHSPTVNAKLCSSSDIGTVGRVYRRKGIDAW